LGDVVFVSIFSLALVLGANLTQRDGDLAKHLRIGESIIEQGQLPLVDVYSHTAAGVDMVPMEWLSQTWLAAAEKFFGFDGVGILTAILTALPWMILYRWMIRRGSPVGLSLGLSLLGAAASVIHWSARPHMFTWLFVVIWVIVLDDLRSKRRKQVWILVPFALLWVNFHGGFFVGYILIGTYLIGSIADRMFGLSKAPDSKRMERHLSLVFLSTIAVSFINPTGARGFIYPFAHLSGDDFLFEFTREFTSPDFHNIFFWPFLLMVLLSIAVPMKWDTTNLLLTVSWTGLALYAFRNIPIYALVVTPVLVGALSNLAYDSRVRLPERLRGFASVELRIAGGSLSVLLVILVAFSMARTPESPFDFSPGYFPIEAVESLGESPPGDHVFNQFVWGGYLAYCCQGEIPVFIDGQTDHYGPELTREYDQAINGRPEWRAVFREHSIDWVLIRPDVSLAQVLGESADWTEMYRDETAVMFVPAP
jgi:hypothetical protein